MKLNKNHLFGFANKANQKNDAMVGTKGYGPKRGGGNRKNRK